MNTRPEIAQKLILQKTAIVIAGPTGSGKTDCAVETALMLDGEVISADSRQIYKHMAISTAQPEARHVQQVKHHLISELEPDMYFSAGEFAVRASGIAEDCFKRNKVPVVAGGSGLYLRAFTDGFYYEDSRSEELRNRLNSLLAEKGKAHMYEMLSEVDPESAAKTTPAFSRRVLRALEVFMMTGKKISELQLNNSEPAFRTIKFAIHIPREQLYERINKRAEAMIESGLLKEVEDLLKRGYHYSRNNPVNTVGVKEVMKYLEGDYSYESMLELVKQNSRRYAKRQMTWLRKERNLIWIRPEGDGENPGSEAAGLISGELERRCV